MDDALLYGADVISFAEYALSDGEGKKSIRFCRDDATSYLDNFIDSSFVYLQFHTNWYIGIFVA